MKTENRQIDGRFFLYARKSSESEDRQMASIESQIGELERIAIEMNLTIVGSFSESQSAKAPGRPVFSDMIRRIEAGEADGILCWKLNRLARNPIDGGTVSWLLQQNVVKRIQTFGRAYYPTDNVLLMAVELGMANQFIRDLSTDTKRGLRAKAERGWYPVFATLGYMHNPLKYKGEKEIIPDPERFPLVRRMWDLMLTGKHNRASVWKVANEEWGLKTRKGNKIARSSIYQIFEDTFYYGEFEYPKGSGLRHQGLHEPMITKEEFDKVQCLLGKATTRPKSYDFALRGPISCGECGAMITAERKVKRQKNGNTHFYTYYHCTKRKNPNCSQPSIEEAMLQAQVHDRLARIEIPASFKEWAMEILREDNKGEAESRERIMASHRKAYDQAVRKLDGLIDLRAAGEITQEEFAHRKGALLSDKESAEQRLKQTHNRADEWISIIEDKLSFAERAKFEFENGGISKKREILQSLGSNPQLKDRIFSVSLPESLKRLETAASIAREINDRFEPINNKENLEDLRETYSQNPVLLRG